MRYTDIMYKDNKYRGVKFTVHRAVRYDFRYSDYDTSTQNDNGYSTDTIYWFKFEPIDWRVLDPTTGLVMCETIIDSQPYSNTIYSNGGGTYGYFNDSSYKNYASDYETSSIRQWLNNDFYNAAFTDSEKKEINTTTLNNDGYYTSIGTTGYEALDSNSTNDKIFLLSYNEARNSNYGFNSSASADDTARRAQGSDYAKSQGLEVSSNNLSSWLLRSPGHSSYNCSYFGGGVFYIYLHTDVNVSDIRGGVRPALRFNRISGIVNPEESEVTTGYKREHVVDNWKALNQSYKSEYLAGFAVPMDGTNGNPDYLIPGQSENMIPQGLTYWPEKDWVLVSSYDKNVENPSAIFALDRETGAFVAQFNMYTKDGKAWKTHAGGIGVSEHNLYITCDRGVAYFSLSDLDVPSGTVKDITRADYMIVPYLYNAEEPDETAYTAYVSVSDGVLWTGNFYSDTPCGKAIGKLDILPENWFWKATDKNNSIIVGYKLSGDSSENEWTKLKNSNHAAKYVINVDNNIDCIQGIAFKKISDKRYNLYLSRTTDASFGALISVSTINLDKNKIDLEEEDCRYFKNLPGTEGIAFIGDDLHVVYESGALSNYKEFFNQAVWNQYFKDCTDVIWKVNESDLLSIPDVKEEWFEKTDGAYSGYNHELAQFCADFSLVGYSYNENDYRYYFDKAGFTLRDCEVKAGRDEVNFFIADKTINVNGVDKNLIFVGCIGSYQNQWYSDFDPLGKDRDKEYADKSENYLTHISFADAREYVYGKLEEYIKNDPNSIILLTGHSRGAATVNVLVAKLIDNASTLGLNANNIYTYGFATPNTVHTCTKCGNGYTSNITAMLTHNFSDWYTVTDATCEEKGTEQRDCSECDYSETQEIPATGHEFNGSGCKNCDYDKANDCGCNCHKGGIAGFFFKLILFFQKIFKTNQICEGCGIKHY